MLFSTLSTSIASAVPLASSEIRYFQTETMHVLQPDDVGFTARAPPIAVSNVAVTGGATVMQGSSFDLHGQEAVAALFGFGSRFYAPNTADDVLLLPSPTAVGSGRRAEPGVASHGGSLPTIGQGDTWLRGTSGNAGRVPSQVAEQLSGQEFRNFDHFRQEFWKAAANDPVLRRQFDTADQFRMQNGYAPRAPVDQQVGGRVKYELDHNQELQNGGNVYDMNNIVIRTPLNHIRGK